MYVLVLLLLVQEDRVHNTTYQVPEANVLRSTSNNVVLDLLDTASSRCIGHTKLEVVRMKLSS